MNNSLKISLIFFTLFLLIKTDVVHSAQQKRRIEEEKRQSLNLAQSKIIQDTERLLFEYGGWLNFRHINYNNDDNDLSTLDTLDETYSYDTRFWLKATLKPSADDTFENEQAFYLRIKDLYIEQYGADVGDRYDHDGPHIDYAYLILDLRPYWLEVGRRYFKVGKGIAYSNVNDGLQVNFLRPRWNIGAFISHTLPHEDNVDSSVPGFSKESDRFYYGLGAGYAGIRNHELYSYLLIQRDFSDEEPNDPIQQFAYNSEYIGIGAKGKITPNLDYWVEFIKESGKSFVFGTNKKSDIDAWAADLEVNYAMMVYGDPRFSIEYAYGSGDADRINVTDTEDGNTVGDDENFHYFGYLQSGFALAPRLSNIHLFKIGLSCHPLERTTLFKNLSLGVDYYLYYKDKSTGGTSDLEASEDSMDIGSEIDLNIDWQILSDLTISLEYGHFMPGEAFAASANDNEDYFSLSMTHTF